MQINCTARTLSEICRFGQFLIGLLIRRERDISFNKTAMRHVIHFREVNFKAVNLPIEFRTEYFTYVINLSARS